MKAKRSFTHVDELCAEFKRALFSYCDPPVIRAVLLQVDGSFKLSIIEGLEKNVRNGVTRKWEGG